MRKIQKIRITHVGNSWVEYIDMEASEKQGAISLNWFEGIPSVNDKYTLVTNHSTVISVSKITNTMYARCLNDKACRLVENFEYEVVEVKYIQGFGETYFLLLADGLLYAGCHFTVTYYK